MSGTRRGHITASSFHDIFVFKEKKDPLKRLLQPQDISNIPAIKWEVDKEDTAKSASTGCQLLLSSLRCKS